MSESTGPKTWFCAQCRYDWDGPPVCPFCSRGATHHKKDWKPAPLKMKPSEFSPEQHAKIDEKIAANLQNADMWTKLRDFFENATPEQMQAEIDKRPHLQGCTEEFLPPETVAVPREVFERIKEALNDCIDRIEGIDHVEDKGWDERDVTKPAKALLEELKEVR